MDEVPQVPDALQEPFRSALLTAADAWAADLRARLVSVVLFGSVARRLRRGRALGNARAYARAGEPAGPLGRRELVLGPEAGLPLRGCGGAVTSSRMGRLYVEEARGRIALVHLALQKGLWAATVRE